jgi:hypothetical protein
MKIPEFVLSSSFIRSPYEIVCLFIASMNTPLSVTIGYGPSQSCEMGLYRSSIIYEYRPFFKEQRPHNGKIQTGIHFTFSNTCSVHGQELLLQSIGNHLHDLTVKSEPYLQCNQDGSFTI